VSATRYWLLGLWGLGVALGGCGGAESAEPPLCVPGETRLCEGPGGCEGAQYCLPDGAALSACDCGESSSVEAAPDYSECADEGSCNLPNRLAAPCQVDADCGSGLSCWSSTGTQFAGFGGVPAGGYCTLGCSEPEDCQHLEPGAGCNVPAGMDSGVCLRGCLSKEPRPLERKCLDRSDVACWSVAVLGLQAFSVSGRQQGNCMPACGSDAECSVGYCDLSAGLCVSEPRLGAEIGAGCGSDADCASGLCASPLTGEAYCTAPCVFGTLGCGFAEAAQRREATCAAPFLSEGGVSEGLGDVGSCFELCDALDPCSSPEWQCFAGGPAGRGVCQFVGNVGGAL
jgi:hypothetical protein